jgi:arginyl-tRNA synthetase
VLPIIRSDGTALYPVADLALASEKFKRYKLDESIYVVDVRQSLHFKQLFKVLELVGYNQPFRHLTYDFVTLPDGMMASRTGKVITYQELRDKLIEKLISETTRRRPEWSTVKIKHVAENLAVSTMKFEMLKVGAEKIITFNIEEALRFDGYTACYLQYGYARLRSIIRKGGFRCFSFVADFGLLSERKEKELLVKIAQYPEIISAAMTKYNPSELAKYLFELVQLFNDYYHDVNILKAAKKTRCARIKLIKAVSIVLKNGFSILGIEALERM